MDKAGEELRKIQLLEKRMMGDAHPGNSHSRGKLGSNSNSVDFVSVNAGHSQTEISGSVTTVKDPSSPSPTSSNGSTENKQNAVPSSSSGGSGKKKVAAKMTLLQAAGNKDDVIAFSASFHPEDSNHSNSISRISPLKAHPTAKYSAAKVRRGPNSGEKRKGGPESAIKDINSVLKHMDVPVEPADTAEEGPLLKQARTSTGSSSNAGTSTHASGTSLTAPMTLESSQDGTSQSNPIQEKDGSRGANGGKRTIQAYFAPHSGSEGGGAERNLSKLFGAAAGAAVSGAVNAGSERDANEESVALPAPEVTSDSAASTAAASSSAPARKGKNIKEMPPPAMVPTGANLDKQTRKEIEVLRVGKEQAENKIFRVENELQSAMAKQKALEERNLRVVRTLESVQRDMAMQEARRRRDRLALDCVRLGKISTVRTSATSYGEVWEEGYALKELNRRAEKLVVTREGINKRKNELSTLKRKTKARAKAEQKDVLPSGGGAYNGVDEDCELDFVAESAAIQSHSNQLQKDETALTEERRMLEAEKAAHQKELKRCQSEDKSRFYKTLPCLHDRYLLVSMLGRGGFSEVWKALDLIELRDVAIKIHQLNPVWSEDRKNSYIRHVTREYSIHREMKHPRVVQLFDVFEIDSNSFATVLELCRGIDLDEKLKRCRMIPEKDARTVLLQIVSGLRYLNIPSTPGEGEEQGREQHGGLGGAGGTGAKRMAIIHYDLKPANILFDDMGDAKITDFGLSKIIDDSNDDESLELTSQGAGTYWYLPPECFAKGDEHGNPRVSSKVDVWSLGVIFYQMLFGKRPFGEGKSQELVLREGVILNAHQVEFPTNGPKVSDEAMEFIKACLTHSKDHRPDVHALCMHTYLSAKTKV